MLHDTRLATGNAARRRSKPCTPGRVGAGTRRESTPHHHPVRSPRIDPTSPLFARRWRSRRSHRRRACSHPEWRGPGALSHPRSFVGADQPMATPACRRKPGSRCHDRGRARAAGRFPIPPPVEGERGRVRVEPFGIRAVLAMVHQHVHQRVPYRTRRGEHARVVSIAPDPTAPPERPVHDACEPDRESGASARQRARILRFDDEVDVIRLHRVLHDPEGVSRGRSQSGPEGLEDHGSPERANRVDGSEGEMDGVGRHMARPRAMRDAAASTGSQLPSCADPGSSP